MITRSPISIFVTSVIPSSISPLREFVPGSQGARCLLRAHRAERFLGQGAQRIAGPPRVACQKKVSQNFQLNFAYQGLRTSPASICCTSTLYDLTRSRLANAWVMY